MSTASLSLASGLATEARAYWNGYLWHHRHPTTRLLHRIGSSVCLFGLGATLVGAGWEWVPLSIVVGYALSFAGHYLVEGNRPLTLKHPVRAAICNWVMFVYEMMYSVEDALRRLEGCPPMTDDQDSQ
jgi:hypothetical protein